MFLEELIKYLEKANPAQRVRLGFANPHSYRMHYSELAFEPEEDTTVGAMLACAREALDNTYEGWKGGDYVMDKYAECYLAVRGDPGCEISRLLLDLLLGRGIDGWIDWTYEDHPWRRRKPEDPRLAYTAAIGADE